MAQQSRDAGEPGREYESLDVLAPTHCVREHHQDARIAFHRAADVAHEDDWPPAQPRALVEEAHELAAGTDRVPGRPAQIDSARPRRAKPARLAFLHPPWRLRQHAPDLLGLLPRHRVEVLVAPHLLGGAAARRPGPSARFILPSPPPLT